MTRAIRFLVAAILALFLLFLIFAVWFNRNAKPIIEERLSRMLQRSVTVEKARMSFPVSLQLSGLSIEGLLWAEHAQVHCDLWSLLGSDIRLSKVALDQPVLTLHRTSDQRIIWADDRPASPSSASSKSSVEHRTAAIQQLQVTGGRIEFPDHSLAEEDSSMYLDQVDLEAAQVPLTGQPSDVRFDIWARIKGGDVPFSGDGLKGSGWFNWPARNMNATFKIVNPQGKIDVEVNLDSKKNAMMVRGHVMTRRMNLKSEHEDEDSMEHLLLDAVTTAGMELNLEFSFPTKMDQWELRNIDFSGNLVAADEGKTSAQKLEDLKAIGHQFKAVGEKIYEQYNKEEKR